ncbi:MAG: translation initiation factor IF-2 N-terminal domain-containing protein, partial [Lachnospiraceae bacterium]
MAKVKVHELAKELNIQSKEILQYLAEQNIEVKSHMSSIEDDVINVVKKKFEKSEAAKAPVKEAVKEAKETKETEEAAERPKKKSSITAVYNPQNSKQPNNRRNAQGQNANRPQGNRPARPQGERPARPQGERPARPQGERPARPQGDRPVRAQSTDRPNERRPRNEENNRQNQNGRTGNRASSNYNQNNRGNGRVGQNRQKESRGKLDQEINKFNKNSVAAVEEPAGKDRRDTRRNDKKKGQNKDNFGNKKQERYVNLEKNGGKKKKQPQQPQEKKEETIRTIVLPDSLTIKELAEKMKVQPAEIVKKLFLKGTMVTVNQDVDFDTAEEIALEFNCLAEH